MRTRRKRCFLNYWQVHLKNAKLTCNIKYQTHQSTGSDFIDNEANKIWYIIINIQKNEIGEDCSES